MNTSLTVLADGARTLLGLELTGEQLEAFERYAAELIAWNRRVNLTAITEPGEIAVKHFLDSLTCLLVLGTQAGIRLVDIGTGAGFPGLPLKIARPDLRLTLVDSVEKKLAFCRHLVSLLGLRDVETAQARAEDLGRDPDHREAYDWAVARAVGPLPALGEYLLPLVRRGGRAIAMKGETGPAEAQGARGTLELLGGKLVQIEPVVLPGLAEGRFLIVMEKVRATPPGYPRRAGVPRRRALGG
jgi:16S rRNA (guanine527-N7)-methyltransferase